MLWNHLKIKKKPIVTVFSSIYNNGRYFEDALKSLKRQTYPSDLIEHIIFDDCSNDNSAQIVSKLLIKKKHKCTFIKNKKNLGICKNQNKAMKMSRGKYFTTLHDDIWNEKRLEVLVSLIERSNAKFAAVCSNFSIIDKNNKILVETFFSKNYSLPKWVYIFIFFIFFIF